MLRLILLLILAVPPGLSVLGTVRAQENGVQVGMASWYGAELAGNPTASGEAFQPGALTAAHPSLPLGTKVRVRNLENGGPLSFASTTVVRSPRTASSTCRKGRPASLA